MILRSISLLGFLFVFSACGVEPKSENYGIQNTAELVLTAQNHPHGYAQSECFSCHVQVNIHQADRTGTKLVELARKMVAQSGVASCSGCHGRNGVAP